MYRGSDKSVSIDVEELNKREYYRRPDGSRLRQPLQDAGAGLYMRTRVHHHDADMMWLDFTREPGLTITMQTETKRLCEAGSRRFSANQKEYSRHGLIL